MTVEAYPLSWPAGRNRTEDFRREAAKFDVGFARARDNLVDEIKRLTGTTRWGDAKIVISTNLALRRDGLPLANQRQPDDVGVAVYFTYKQHQRCFACDRWMKIEHNMQAIAKTIEALRGIARWGTGDMLDAAFTGFSALPPPTGSVATDEPWHQVLNVPAHAATEDVRMAYRRAALGAHPDKGGSNDAMARVNGAWAKFCAERGL